MTHTKLRQSMIMFLSQANEKAQRELKGTETITSSDKTSIIFTLKNQVGGLARALQVFQELGINVLHLELQNADPSVTQVKHCPLRKCKLK